MAFLLNSPLNNYINRLERKISYLINSSILVTSHKHPLTYCWPEREIYGKEWNCNQCNSNYSNDDRSYYCTFCNYSLCKNCFEDMCVGQVFPYNYNNMRDYYFKNIVQTNFFPCQELLSFHNHSLTRLKIFFGNKKWKCKACLQDIDNNQFFYCSLCDFCICKKCAYLQINQRNQNKNNIINITFEYETKKIQMKFHLGISIDYAFDQFISLNDIPSNLNFIFKGIAINKNDKRKIEEIFSMNEENFVIAYQKYERALIG